MGRYGRQPANVVLRLGVTEVHRLAKSLMDFMEKEHPILPGGE